MNVTHESPAIDDADDARVVVVAAAAATMGKAPDALAASFAEAAAGSARLIAAATLEPNKTRLPQRTRATSLLCREP